VLYAFDPGARGAAPVERFKEAAEKFGWIIAGSNNSRNGAMKPSIDSWNAILKDTHARFAIDDERVYVAGFSGAARLAIYFGVRCADCIAGVIGCSAGFPEGVEPSPAWHFVLFNTAGVDDFNFAEVKSIEEPLTKAGITHRTEVFAGRHEWPPASLASEALEWMELQAMRTGKRPRDANLIDSVWQRQLEVARVLEDSKEIYDAYRVYIALNNGFKGLRDVATVAQKVNQLRDHPAVKTALREEQQQIKKQRDIEDRLGALSAARRQSSEGSNDDRASTDVGLDPGTRLKGMYADLRKQAARAEDNGERRVARRVLGGSFVGLIEQGINLLETQKRYAEAVRTFELATEINPERAGPFFYLAWANAASGNKKKALQALQTAVEKGFSDLGAITGNKAFDSIRNDEQYGEIIQVIQSKH